MHTTFTHRYAKAIYVTGIAFCLVPGISPALALGVGIVFGLIGINPWPRYSAQASKILLQSAVVGLGFGLPLQQVWTVGRASFGVTLAGILLTLGLGIMFGRMLHIPKHTSLLVACGTAICGGSAIAAIAPTIQAEDDESAIALATVFTLNAVALVLFPVVGHLLHMGQNQFGTWAGMAIHDTSSVVGAAASYGNAALEHATTVKLTRALWIVPVAFAASSLNRSKSRTRIPMFILLFIAAAAIHTLLPQAQPVWSWISTSAKQLLVLSLFFVGTALTRELLRKVGPRTFIQGTALWLCISGLTLLGIQGGLI
ncbi:MAG: putative sulfate exporter family transporter [Geobacteraceae bacterium]|nr:putative sulfate exporter family transporter [Geobacteraceae bacterium]